MVQFRVGEEGEDVGTGEDVSFQNTSTKIYTCFILDTNCYRIVIFLSSHINTGHILELHMPVLFFLLIELVRMVRVCAISF